MEQFARSLSQQVGIGLLVSMALCWWKALLKELNHRLRMLVGAVAMVV